MNDQRNPAMQTLDAYRQTVAARDVEAFLALYDEDVHRFDTWDDLEQAGIADWRAAVTDWFGSHPDEMFEVRLDEAQASVGDNVAFVRAMMTFTVIANGKPTHTQVNRFTAALEKKGGAWKIVHEHTSMPISYETGEGILSR